MEATHDSAMVQASKRAAQFMVNRLYSVISTRWCEWLGRTSTCTSTLMVEGLVRSAAHVVTTALSDDAKMRVIQQRAGTLKFENVRGHSAS